MCQAVHAEMEHLHDVDGQLCMVRADEEGALDVLKGIEVIPQG